MNSFTNKEIKYMTMDSSTLLFGLYQGSDLIWKWDPIVLKIFHDGTISTETGGTYPSFIDYNSNGQGDPNNIKELWIRKNSYTIQDYSFRNCTGLESVKGALQKTLENYCFIGCTNLTNIDLPILYSAGDGAFQSSGIKTADFQNLWRIGDHCFNGCTYLETVNMPALTTWNYIRSGTSHFKGCSSLKSVSIPKVTYIPEACFEDCSALTDFTMPAQITSIGKNAFHNSGVHYVTIPDTCTTIGGGAFHNCKDMLMITVPSSVTKIDELAFAGCSKIYSISIPGDVSVLKPATFHSCSRLTRVDLPSSITTIKSGDYTDDSQTSVIIGGCFENCTKLTQIGDDNRLPAKLTSLEPRTFANSGINSITIPKGVTVLSDSLFYNCKGLSVLYLNGKITEIKSQCLMGCDSLRHIIPYNMSIIDWQRMCLKSKNNTNWHYGIPPSCRVDCYDGKCDIDGNRIEEE